jgi:hypothetical protein
MGRALNGSCRPTDLSEPIVTWVVPSIGLDARPIARPVYHVVSGLARQTSVVPCSDWAKNVVPRAGPFSLAQKYTCTADQPAYRAIQRGGTTDQPPVERFGKTGQPTNPSVERSGEAGLLTNSPAEQPSKTTTDSLASTSTRGKSRHNTIKPRQHNKMNHHQTTSIPGEQCRRASVKHDPQYVLRCAPADRWDLSTPVEGTSASEPLQ